MIRFARLEDLQDILTIYNDAILNTTAVYTYKPQQLDERLQWYQWTGYRFSIIREFNSLR